MLAQYSSNCIFHHYHHILVHTSDRNLVPHQRSSQHPELKRLDQHYFPCRRGQLTENQSNASYPTRSQARILNPRRSLARSENTYITRSPSSNLCKKKSLLDKWPSRSAQIQSPILVETLYSTRGHGNQKARKETETKEEKPCPTKTNPDTGT